MVYEIIGIFIFVFLIAILIFSRTRRDKEIINNWAQGNSYKILYYEFKFFSFPLSFLCYVGQLIYLVEIEKSDGQKRMGLVVVGSIITGIMFKKEINRVVWEDN